MDYFFLSLRKIKPYESISCSFDMLILCNAFKLRDFFLVWSKYYDSIHHLISLIPLIELRRASKPISFIASTIFSALINEGKNTTRAENSQISIISLSFLPCLSLSDTFICSTPSLKTIVPSIFFTQLWQVIPSTSIITSLYTSSLF